MHRHDAPNIAITGPSQIEIITQHPNTVLPQIMQLLNNIPNATVNEVYQNIEHIILNIDTSTQILLNIVQRLEQIPEITAMSFGLERND